MKALGGRGTLAFRAWDFALYVGIEAFMTVEDLREELDGAGLFESEFAPLFRVGTRMMRNI